MKEMNETFNERYIKPSFVQLVWHLDVREVIS